MSCLASVVEDATTLAETWSTKVEGESEGPPTNLQEKRVGWWGKDGGREWLEGGSEQDEKETKEITTNWYLYYALVLGASSNDPTTNG